MSANVETVRDECFAWEKVKERFIEEFIKVEEGYKEITGKD